MKRVLIGLLLIAPLSASAYEQRNGISTAIRVFHTGKATDKPSDKNTCGFPCSTQIWLKMPDRSSVEYAIEYGDGNSAQLKSFNCAEGSPDPIDRSRIEKEKREHPYDFCVYTEHLFNAPGTFQVSVKRGDQTVDSFKVDVLNKSEMFEALVTEGKAPLKVVFTVYNKFFFEHTLDFGDGTPKFDFPTDSIVDVNNRLHGKNFLMETKTVTHIYDKAGDFVAAFDPSRNNPAVAVGKVRITVK